MTIGERIQTLRKERNITQKQLSEMIGKGFSTVQKYEINAIQPPIDIIAKIAAALSVSVPDLLSGVDSVVVNLHEQAEREKRDIRSPINLRLYREQMLQAYEQLNAIGKKTAMERIIELSEIERYTAPDLPQD